MIGQALRSLPRRPRSGPLTIAAVFVALAVWSWRKWPDLLVDFGQQLYIPWQLAEGARLHREIAFLHGPLSQHVNAVLFWRFGPSLTVLIVLNLAALACLTWVVYKTVRLGGDRLTATTACLVLLTVFGFSQYVWTGNYNYISPYTHEATHGIVLSAVMILALSRGLTRGGRGWWAISPKKWSINGLLLGPSRGETVVVGSRLRIVRTSFLVRATL